MGGGGEKLSFDPGFDWILTVSVNCCFFPNRDHWLCCSLSQQALGERQEYTLDRLITHHNKNTHSIHSHLEGS